MGPYGSQSFKTLLLPQITIWTFSTFSWIFFSVVLTKVLFWIFELLSFRFLTFFLILPLYPMGKPKTSISGKRATVERNGVKFGPQGWVFNVHRGTFDTSVINVILGSFGAFPIFEKPVSRKRLVIERNGIKFGPGRWVFSVHRVFLTPKWLRSFWGHLVLFRFRQPCISKMAVRRAKESETWVSGVNNQFIQGTFDSYSEFIGCSP